MSAPPVALPPFHPDVFQRLLQLSSQAHARTPEQQWQYLEAAHVYGQSRYVPHLKTHARMLSLARQTRDWPELAGQLLRLALVTPGHVLKRLPRGNPGRANVSAFRALPVRQDLHDTIVAVARQLGH